MAASSGHVLTDHSSTLNTGTIACVPVPSHHSCQLPGPVHPSGQFKLLLQHRWGTIHINSPTHPYSCPHLFCTRNRKITASVCCRERVNCDERRQISAVHLTKCCTFSCRCCCGISLTVKHRDYPLPFPSFPEQQNKQTNKSHCGPSR